MKLILWIFFTEDSNKNDIKPILQFSFVAKYSNFTIFFVWTLMFVEWCVLLLVRSVNYTGSQLSSQWTIWFTRHSMTWTYFSLRNILIKVKQASVLKPWSKCFFVTVDIIFNPCICMNCSSHILNWM